MQRTIGVRREAELLCEDFHGFRPEGVKKPELCQVDIGVAITLSIGVRGDAFEIEIVEFGIDLKARTERFSFVSGVEVGIERKRVLHIVRRAHLPGPVVHRTIVFVVSSRSGNADPIGYVAMQNQPSARLLIGPDILRLIGIHAKNGGERPRIGHEAIIFSGKSKSPQRPLV